MRLILPSPSLSPVVSQKDVPPLLWMPSLSSFHGHFPERKVLSILKTETDRLRLRERRQRNVLFLLILIIFENWYESNLYYRFFDADLYNQLYDNVPLKSQRKSKKKTARKYDYIGVPTSIAEG